MKMKAKQKHTILLILVCISMVFWGMSWSSAKVLGRYGDALSVAFIRFGVVILMLWPTIKVMKLRFQIKKPGLKYLFGAAIFLGLYTTSFFRGLQLGNAGAAGVLVTVTNPLFAFLIGLIISRMIPKKMELLGLGLGLLGGSFLLKIWDNTDTIFDPGNLLFIAASLLWALMSKMTSFSKPHTHPIVFSFWLHLTVPVLMIPFVDFNDVLNIFKTADGLFWWNMAYFGIINSSFATVTYLTATTIIGAEKASTFIFLVPVSAVITSYFTLGEIIQWHTVIGLVFGVLAVMIINGTFSKKKKYQKPEAGSQE